jgi:hypothetical protein
MARYVADHHQLSWLMTRMQLLTLECEECEKPIEEGQEVQSLSKHGLYSNFRIFHSKCYDEMQARIKAEKPLKKPKFTTNFTINQYFCNVCKEATKAIIFRGRSGKIWGLICPKCGSPFLINQENKNLVT